VELPYKSDKERIGNIFIQNFFMLFENPIPSTHCTNLIEFQRDRWQRKCFLWGFSRPRRWRRWWWGTYERQTL